ncbi:bifunctional heptose 7-phosphate kinase/heptose 1-phosphate adenyltransferase [Rhodoplanes elegans]|uniref:Bifunctional protein HldE n=1 Tax=Rhodoplanes elegans TaxID=29408 RepID=A0A327K255_9BRAD|nr:D-glycero-beta-D-manno-heptose-7-phosphate kinase [Rhodoplanes elegans]MBK5956766.1 bifunctional heptose 7-phosphate kinase/heptose 1-phosphate adenyltransferase [Rhodoplanes elegans]RAI31866.1 bifunctional heptose 7-phosphate kinase/heptose 1-phosphate adenyltransferase [Rhodoplanes elegans]
MLDVELSLSRIPSQTIVCVGDLMLDQFVYGEVSRVSPEAPVPVIAVKREETTIGGAGNVACNIATLGAACVFVGVVGDDAAGQTLRDAFARHDGRVDARLVVDPERPTIRKLRFVSEHYSSHLLRADWERAAPVPEAIEDEILAQVDAVLPDAGAVVLSDYAKGVLTPRVVRGVIARAKALGKPVIVDPKGRDFAVYRGATLITPNRKELGEASRRPLADLDTVAVAAEELRRTAESDALLVTLSEEGMLLKEAGRSAVHVPAAPVRVRDVSGAGDTVVAVLALMLATEAGFEAAMRAANAAAAVVVGKRGTATVSVLELRSQLLPAAALASEEKIVFDHALLGERVAAWRKQGLRIGFTNGCFDILHPGHVRVLSQARAACDRLVVGLNSDASVKRLKGEGRPIQDVVARADVLAALEAVDLVAVFEEDTPIELIKRLRPNVLIKGSDYRVDQVVGHDVVASYGGEVVLVDLVPGHSTTGILKKSGQAPDRAGGPAVPDTMPG